MTLWKDIDPAEVTPEHVYRNRRSLLRGIGALALGAGGAAALSACGGVSGGDGGPGEMSPVWPAPEQDVPTESPNSLNDISTYNNYYEFSTDKEAPARLARGFKTEPWTVAVGGLVGKSKTFAMEELLQQFPQEERIYRLRCVEGWSMVIPWQGFPLRQLLEQVEPTSQAKFVRFEAVKRPEEMPGQKSPFYTWPYVEGLRLDEAMNDLSLLVTGLYGQPLPPQNGAPLRLALPWKYGFKSIKGIVKIDLVDKQPTSLWMAAAPNEYGFFANVNPDVPHPRWSQSTERRIGEVRRRRTLPFNGYAQQVADLYKGLDLRNNY